VPGVVLLDHVFAAASEAGLPPPARIASAKFTRPVLPGETVALTLRRTPGGRIAFAASCDDARAFAGEYEP
jgi:3-hydroxymyristoyl/3-hydroxydecanoyl-(acyl carrier protein) dehydratase